VNALSPILRLMRTGLEWLDTRWKLHEVYARRDYLGADLPRLVIAERELRP
jgi:hypothetical protein